MDKLKKDFVPTVVYSSYIPNEETELRWWFHSGTILVDQSQPFPELLKLETPKGVTGVYQLMRYHK
jgi:hypothetical protein